MMIQIEISIRNFCSGWRLIALGFAVCLISALDYKTETARAADDVPADAKQIEFFETQVKPLLKANCFKCHGAKTKIKGKFRLTTRAGLLRGGELGKVISLDSPDKSLLLKAISYTDVDLEMPPKGKLKQGDIDILTRWVKMGVPWTPGDKGPVVSKVSGIEVTPEAMKFWSFQPVKRPPVPQVKNKKWVTNEIDAFLLGKLEKNSLSPAPPAEKFALLRRAYYDLIGLPPTPQQVDSFLADKSPGAFEKVIDRLLESPQYGEKWGRHWLDLVHYAETNSFERDNPKPEVWRYRDYIIQSFNDDKPYDQFVREQLAGDEVDHVTAESIIATGYYRLGLWDDESSDAVLTRYDELDDIVSTTGKVFLGLTVNCARCHNHKIDPFPQENYYQLLAFFRGVKSFQNNGRKGFAKGNYLTNISSVVSQETKKKYEKALKDGTKRLTQLNKEIGEIEKAAGAKLTGGAKDDFAYESYRLPILREHVGKVISKEGLARYERLAKERKQINYIKSIVNAKALSVKGSSKVPATHILIRGNPNAPGEKVEPGFPTVLGWPKPQIKAPKNSSKSSGRRLALAQWITDEKNQLTSRVMVNRLWQHHFGRGIVRSSSNFGFKGTPPTHPELLDWLASEFVQRGWRLKTMHKLIMLSSAYRMSSQGNPQALAKDPQNNLFWRFNMRRLTAEEIRDSILAVIGKLNLKMGGPSIKPEIPKEVLAGQSRPGSGWKKSSPEDQARRSVYVHVKRTLLLPILERFDLADTDGTCPVRFITTQPIQALGMLNSKFINDQAKIFAQGLKKNSKDTRAQVEKALRRALARRVKASEIDRGVELIKNLQEKEGASADEALYYFCLMTLNLNEFMYLD